jgi:hypothetical protein
VDPRGGLDDVENRKFLTLPELELQPLRRPARSQSLYRLHYPWSRRRRWVDNIKIDLRDIVWGGMDWIE